MKCEWAGCSRVAAFVDASGYQHCKPHEALHHAIDRDNESAILAISTRLDDLPERDAS